MTTEKILLDIADINASGYFLFRKKTLFEGKKERAVNIDYGNIKNGNIEFILTLKREHRT